METCYLLVTILLALVKTVKADLEICNNNTTQEINETGKCFIANGTCDWTCLGWRKVESNTSWNIAQVNCEGSSGRVDTSCLPPQSDRKNYSLTFMYRMLGIEPLHLTVVLNYNGRNKTDIWKASGEVTNWTNATIPLSLALVHSFKSITIQALKEGNSVIQLAKIQYLDSSWCCFQTTTDSVPSTLTTQISPNGGMNKFLYVIAFLIPIVAALILGVIIVQRFYPNLRRKLSRTHLEMQELVEVLYSHGPCPQEFSTSDTAITRYSDGYLIPITNKPEDTRQVPDSTGTIRETRGDNVDETYCDNPHERYEPSLRASGLYDLLSCPRNLEHVTDYNHLDFTPHNDVTKAGRKAYDRVDYDKGDNYDTLRCDRKCHAIDSNYDHVE